MDAFDKSALQDEIGDDPEFLEEALEMLEADAPALLQRIREAIDRDDAEAVATEAHTIKSMVGNFCARPAYDAALTMETLGRTGCLSGGVTHLEALDREVIRLKQALRAYLDRGE